MWNLGYTYDSGVDKMKCPKCGKPINQKANKSFYCLFCGYMENGNTITKTKKNISASDLEIYLGDRFDKVYRNENMFTIFLLVIFSHKCPTNAHNNDVNPNRRQKVDTCRQFLV